MSVGDNGNDGIERERVTVITVTFNHATSVVALGAKDVPISLAQMMIHEAAVQLDIMRRQVAAMELQQQLRAAAENARVADAIRNRR